MVREPSRQGLRKGDTLAELTLSRRKFLIAGVAGSSWLLTACTFGEGGDPSTTTTGPTPTGSVSPSGSSPYQLGTLETTKIVTDPALFPTTFQEAPELTALVESGDLPPVAERIGANPIVLQPVHEPGTYSTTDIIRRGMLEGDSNNVERFAVGPTTLSWSNEWGSYDSFVPNIAMAWEESDDGLIFTVHLRPGMRWSDGEPFTADDAVFAFEEVYKHPDIGAYPDSSFQVEGQDFVAEKVDDATFRYVLPAPTYLFLPWLIGQYGFELGRYGSSPFLPKHYLEQFHPAYVGQDEANRLADDAGYDDWATHFLNRSDWLLNADLPVVTPWKVEAGTEFNTRNFRLHRNPYSIWVDTAGNQLPYIGTIEYDVVGSEESLNLSVISGEYDFQDRGVDMNKLPLLIENQEQGNYRVYLDPSDEVDFGVRINLSYEEDPEIGDLFRTADFRRALSLGLDRDQINQASFLGIGVPSAGVPGPGNLYYPGDQYWQMWATHDVDQANALLDGLGLEMGSDGFRLRRDGEGRLRLRFSGANPAIGEIIQQHWRDIGVDVNVEQPSITLLQQQAFGNKIQLFGHQLYVSDLFNFPYSAFPSDNTSFFGLNGIEYATWFVSNGRKGTEPFPELKDLMERWNAGSVAPEEERIQIGKEWWQRYAELCLQIGCIAQTVAVNGIHIARDTMGNVPERVKNNANSLPFINGWPVAFYYQ